MNGPAEKIGLADLIKNTIEDVALTRAIKAGLGTNIILPTVEFKTKLIQRRNLKFLQSFMDDFARVRDGKTKADIFKLVTHLSDGKKNANFKDITTKNISLNFARIKIGSTFVCLAFEEEKIVLVRVISQKEITKFFLRVI